MKLKDLIHHLESLAPRQLQEDYDNSGLQVGDPEAEVASVLICLDCTEEVVEEAKVHGAGLIISHHPVIFKGLKSITGRTYVERTIVKAIKYGIAIYSIHTNLDNVLSGVNGEIAQRLGLKPIGVLDPKPGQLRKLVVFVPNEHAEKVRSAMFAAGAGGIGNYDECSFNIQGTGTFKAGAGADPFVGKIGQRHEEPEVHVEVLVRSTQENQVLQAMREAHPYEEVAYDLYPLLNTDRFTGSGLVGEWEEPLEGKAFLERLKQVFRLKVIRHTQLLDRPVKKVALCGGSGSFLINKAIAAGADAFVTGDIKYHQFFDADGRLLIADIGHYGSEQYTMNLIQRLLNEKFPTFAVRLTETVTDPIYHY
jgi:dinuclear metal center YbgI/SA1388 family protein